MGILQALFGGGASSETVRNLLEEGAVVVDVRSRGEFQSGHVVGSRNIPLPEVSNRIQEFKKIKKPIVLCCASGNRSGQAERYLKSEGIDCVNGGGWTNVNALV